MEPKKSNSIQIAIQSFESLYYAIAASGMPFISKLSVSSTELLTDVTLKIRVVAASGQVSHDYSIDVAQLGPKALEFNNLQVAFDPNKMYQIVDPQAGQTEIDVLSGETLIASVSWEIEILPANFWKNGDSYALSAYHALASFVQPNHPAIRPILDSAVEKLSEGSGRGALSGYQQPAYVDAMVQAIYSSIQDRKIAYSDPPASWSGGPGQKIRTAQEILEEGVGTCLDTTMLFASCLEQAGLAPIVFLIPGHAFVGYWSGEFVARYEGEVPRMATILPIDARANEIDLGLIRLVETTALTKESSFAEAEVEAKLRLESEHAYGENRYWSVGIDIVSCRRSDRPIHPLPARFVKENGEVEVVEYRPAVVDMDMLRERFAKRDAIAANTVSLSVPPTVRRWLDSLLDLSLRNPLINFANKRSAVRLLIPTGSLGVVEDLLQSQKQFQLAPAPAKKRSDGTAYPLWSDNQRGEVPAHPEFENFLNAGIANPSGLIFTEHSDEDVFVSRMRRTASEAKSILQETGSNGLYLALGSLSWRVPQGEIESPLVLIPVTLTPKNRGTAFMLTIEESGVTPNFSLVEKLKIEHGVNLEGLASLQTDQFGIDVDGTLKYVREQLVKEGLQDFKVNASATLGFFNFSSYRLWKDLLDNWQRFENNPLVKHLIHTPGEAFIDPVTDDSATDLDKLMSELPISADGSQAQAIASAIKGKTFVLQGPPGTGKSQTITNLLAKALDSGKRVLFVAEKRDALDVVKQRIDAAGLGAFSLDLHDKNSTSKAVKQQLGDVIDILIEPDKIGFDSALQDYSNALGPLNNYRTQLHEDGLLGESVYSAMDKYLANDAGTVLTVPGEFIADATDDILQRVTDAAKSVSALGPNAGTSDKNPWSLSDLGRAFEQSELDGLKTILARLESQLSALERDSSTRSYIENSSSIDQLSGLRAVEIDPVTRTTAEFLGTDSATEQLSKGIELLNALSELSMKLSFDTSRLGKVDMNSLENQYRLALGANFLVKGMKVASVAKQANALLGTGKAITKASLVSDFDDLAKLQEVGNKFSAEISRLPGLDFASQPNVFSVDERANLSRKLNDLVTLNVFLLNPPVERSLATSLLSGLQGDVRQAAAGLAQTLRELFDTISANDVSIERWCGSESLGAKLLRIRSELVRDGREYGFSLLVLWNTLRSAADPMVEQGLRDAMEELFTGKVAYADASKAFLKGFYEGLFRNLLVQKGLSTFDGSSVDNYILKLGDAHERLRVRLPKILGSELLSRRGFDGSMKIGAIGDLVLSIKQGRSNIPLRDMLAKHWNVISKMTPCVLASPDSAVRFLSTIFEPFDLVVFDEASQIRVANSIGALGRAKAAVVVGDSQQMPPTTVAVSKISTSEDEEESEIEEHFGEPESILDQCEIARVPNIMLTWHYRSEDESLIAFSNREYYDGKLSTFPTPNLDHSSRRLSLVNVGGQFNRGGKGSAERGGLRTNLVEAEAIVADVISRLHDSKRRDESIAIVTLNEQQKVLIEQLMAQSKDKALVTALDEGVGGEEILVKALEKVQGSERDVVLLSVAFSPKKEDPNNLPLNFGPIINQGGHRRLNVAITRARKEVKVFCSFEPKMLEDRKPTSRGLIDLAKFLTIADAKPEKSVDQLALQEKRLDRHRASVAAELRNAGLTVIEEVGLSDFKVDLAIADPKDPKKAILGILLDGHRWSQRKTVTDRDALPISMLTNRMGWARVERIWLPNWLRNKQAEIERIKSAFNRAKIDGPKTPRKSSPAKAAEPIYTQKSELADQKHGFGANPFDALLDSVPTWSPIQPEILGAQNYLDYLHDKRIQAEVRSIVEQLTAHEGPVSSERLAKLVAACFGFNRVAASRVAAINGIGYPGQVRDKEGFLFPKGVNPDTYSEWQKSPAGSGRSIQDVSIREIRNAMIAISRIAQGVEIDELMKETSRVFGIQKVSKDIAARLEHALNIAVQRGELVQDGQYLKPRD